MIQSMTGFVSSEIPWQGRRILFELKSLNHRHLESKWKLPKELASLEPLLRERVAQRFSRGYFDGRLEWVREAGVGGPGGVQEFSRRINTSQAAQYLEEIKSLQLTLGLVDPISTRDLLMLPDVIDRGDRAPSVAAETSWENIKAGVDTMLDELQKSRVSDGGAMESALHRGLAQIRVQAHAIEQQRTRQLVHVRDVARARIRDILGRDAAGGGGGASSINEERVFSEAALVIDRTDIAEELARLASHLQFFEATLQAGGAVGRKLEFIVQELNRECNTLTSKAQDFDISQQAVEIKVVLEQLRELVLNLE